MRKSLKAFTLIELLIVVAIIAILAAIAVPNFLEAQTRAKVTRVISDMRVLATGLELYRADESTYPPYPEFGQHTGPRYFNALSTPVAYITSASGITDPFRNMQGDDNDGQAAPRYGYFNPQKSPVEWMWKKTPKPRYNGKEMPSNFQYVIVSLGPDAYQGTENKSDARSGFITYDSSNGTKSNGDIYRVGP